MKIGSNDSGRASQTRLLKFTPYFPPPNLTVFHEKFGGLPTGFEQSQWPFSPTTFKPMTFICQLSMRHVMPNEEEAFVAFFFMSPTGDDETECIFDVEDFRKTESKVLISKHLGNDIPVNGPTLPVELSVCWVEVFDVNNYDEPLVTSKMGGSPGWLQDDETPLDPLGMPMAFIGQIDSGDVNDHCVEHYFHDSNIYLFASNDLTATQAIWQFT